jgi:hypothetical protein
MKNVRKIATASDSEKIPALLANTVFTLVVYSGKSHERNIENRMKYMVRMSKGITKILNIILNKSCY